MARLIVKKSKPLRGEVTVSGSKNAVLPIMAATLLTEEECILSEVPALRDVDVMRHLLSSIGAEIESDSSTEQMNVKAETLITDEAPYELVKKMRASILVMGPLLARNGSARIALPGGCKIGSRPIELHLKGLRALGAKIEEHHGYVVAKSERLKGAAVYLDFPSVGATENIMMAATLAEGTTVIENAALEPEIVDLANLLKKMGAKIKGAGTDAIRIEGVESLHGAAHTIIPDRIELGTFMVAAAMTNGDITIRNAVPDHVRPVIAKLREVGAIVECEDEWIRVRGGNKQLVATSIKTLPYPGFPTDMQSQFISLLAGAKGISLVTETIYENRFMNVGELNRMGAGIKIEDRNAVVPGNKLLQGAQVTATDLRAGAALVLAGLVAEGETEIMDIYHIERGYSHLIEKMQSLGADIKRVE